MSNKNFFKMFYFVIVVFEYFWRLNIVAIMMAILHNLNERKNSIWIQWKTQKKACTHDIPCTTRHHACVLRKKYFFRTFSIFAYFLSWNEVLFQWWTLHFVCLLHFIIFDKLLWDKTRSPYGKCRVQRKIRMKCW